MSEPGGDSRNHNVDGCTCVACHNRRMSESSTRKPSEALGKVLDALAELPADERLRVLQAARTFYGIPPHDPEQRPTGPKLPNSRG